MDVIKSNFNFLMKRRKDIPNTDLPIQTTQNLPFPQFNSAMENEWKELEAQMENYEQRLKPEVDFKTGYENGSKNRYDDILPLERTRVVLKEPGKDYINANW